MSVSSRPTLPFADEWEAWALDEQLRQALQARLDRHRRSRGWALFGCSRCRVCGWRWPCLAHRQARRALDGAPSAPQWARLATRPNPAVAPLLTYGQRYRSGGGDDIQRR
jgi:hypothetical protein